MIFTINSQLFHWWKLKEKPLESKCTKKEKTIPVPSGNFTSNMFGLDELIYIYLFLYIVQK